METQNNNTFFFYTGHRQPPPPANLNNIHNHHHHEQQPADFTNTQRLLPYYANKEEMFEKPLTPSDVGKLNRLVIPKQHAEKYFPMLGDQQKGLLLSFEDADADADADESGKIIWRFRYSYWNSSQSYVLTKGWSRYVKDKSLDAGDIVLFHRNIISDSSHTMFIGCRRRRSSAAVLQDPMMMAAQPIATAAQVSEWSTRSVLYDAPHLNYPSSPHPPLSLPALAYQHDYLHAAAAAAAAEAGEFNVENYKRSEVVATRRLRLFGVNLDCPDDSEPSTPYSSSHGGQTDHQYI